MATALQTIDRSLPAPCIALRSDNPALAKLVEDVNPYAQRLVTPAERGYLAALVPRYEEALIAAPQEAIARAVGMLSLAFPAQRVSDDEARSRLKLYSQGLADVPGDLLAEACRDAVRTCKFFPTVSEIRERCREMLMRQWKLSRIKHLIDKHDREWREPEPEAPMSDDDKAKVDGWLRRHGFKDGAGA